jgi:hypothetical protein
VPDILDEIVARKRREVAVARDSVPLAVLEALVANEPDSVQLVTAAELADIDPGLDSFLDIDLPADLARLESRGIPASRP